MFVAGTGAAMTGAAVTEGEGAGVLCELHVIIGNDITIPSINLLLLSDTSLPLLHWSSEIIAEIYIKLLAKYS